MNGKSDHPRASAAETIFNAALELPTAERMAYLAEACAGNARLREKVERLLQAHAEAKGFLPEQPPGLVPDTTVRNRLSATEILGPLMEKPGDKIDRYKLLQKIGEGGCGVVYMAEQDEPVRRRVALKVIKLGMDTKSVIARFEAEQQALAMMDHPHIAKVFDAGATETGRPYFVMELVRGIKITDYCDQNQLSTPERLGLFVQVCQAIQHAHQKGIIHRDIKPSNILVTVNDGVPVPKVIDFGIAKATEQRLTDKTLFTAFEQFIGTPAYMSPEQAVMTSLDIDTRSDIYSLGVLLYELLTGKTPFDAKELAAAGLDEIRRTIREKEPARPSTRLRTMLEGERTTAAQHRRTDAPRLIHLLRGDLDWIVMKCLEKDRMRRYETANGLVRDIQRHLSNEPVVARPPSTAYRVQKLVRRNKLLFATSSTIACALIFGASFSTWSFVKEKRARLGEEKQRRDAERQRQRAEEHQRKAEESDLLTRKHLYAADMLLAYQAFEHGNLVLARQILDQYRPTVAGAGQSPTAAVDLRGWEWRHLRERAAQKDELFVLRGHESTAKGAAILPDGHTVVSTGLGDSLRFWDLNRPTAAPETIAGPKGIVGLNSPLRISSNGRLIGVAGDEAWAVWDTEVRRFIHEGRSGANGLAFSQGSALVEIWFLPEMVKREVHPDHTLFLTDVAVSNDGTRLATSAQDGEIRLWDVATGQRQEIFAGQLVGFWSVAFSPDDSRLAAGGFDGSVTLWDLATHPHRPVAQWKAAWKFCRWLEFRQDGGALFTLGDFTTETGGWHSVIRCWPAPTLADIDARQPQRSP